MKFFSLLTEKRESFCLRDICTSTNFANASLTGRCSLAKASVAGDGVRPCFNLYQSRSTEKRADWWLRDVCTSAYFANANRHGNCSTYNSLGTIGVRPCFNLYRVPITTSCNRAWWWLRDICSSAAFTGVTDHGTCSNAGASYANGVRPCFNLYQSRSTEKRVHFWLRDVCTSVYFADVNSYGACRLDTADTARGVRPCFNLYQKKYREYQCH